MIYAITDRGFRNVTPAVLGEAAQPHWGIENRLHWVRHVTFAEDLSQIRTGNGPAVMATLRNVASACTDWPARPTSLKPAGTPAVTPTE